MTKNERPEISVFALSGQAVSFTKGHCIFHKGDESDGCYLIDKGTVRIVTEDEGGQNPKTIGYLHQGNLVGEFCFCGFTNRTASVFAETDVELRWLSMDAFNQICEKQPDIAIAFTKMINEDLAKKISNTNHRLLDYLTEEYTQQEADTIIKNATKGLSFYTSPEAALMFADAPSDKEIIDLFIERGIDTVCMVADSVFASMDQYITDLESEGKMNRWVVPSERSIPAVAAGRWLATGKLTIMSMQNSGFTNAMDYLRTVMAVHRIPGIVLSSWRGFDSILDNSEPHILIGDLTDMDNRNTMGNDHVFGYRSGANMLEEVNRAIEDSLAGNLSCIRVSPPGFRKEYPLRKPEENAIPRVDRRYYDWIRDSKGKSRDLVESIAPISREEALIQIHNQMKNLDPFYIIGNGFNPRAMQALRLTENTFENAGGMGSSLAIAWGAAKSNPDQIFVAIEGDQNAVMNEMEKVLVYDYPENLYWFILNNGTGESVGPSKSIPLSPWHYELANVIETTCIAPGSFHYRRIDDSGLKFDSEESKALAAEIGNLPAQAALARHILIKREQKK